MLGTRDILLAYLALSWYLKKTFSKYQRLLSIYFSVYTTFEYSFSHGKDFTSYVPNVT